MVPLTQTRVTFPHGNCTETCVASVLGVPIESVPDLRSPPSDPFRERRMAVLTQWLHDHGRVWTVATLDPQLTASEVIGHLPEEVHDDYHLIGGLNHQGSPHMTVGHRGKVVWDPNPSRKGLFIIQRIIFLIPLSVVASKATHINLTPDQRPWRPSRLTRQEPSEPTPTRRPVRTLHRL